MSRSVIVMLSVLLGACDSCARGPAPETVGSARSVPFQERVVPEPKAQGPKQELSARELTWVYDRSPVGPMSAVIWIAERENVDEKLPVLIAMHGRGEVAKGPKRAARGWLDDYWMPRALLRMRALPLVEDDFLGMVSPERLVFFNESLKKTPFRGLIVVMPSTPDILGGGRAFSQADPLARFLVDDLLPRVYRETPAIGTAETTGIDGVSLGGRAALLVGFSKPEAFGVVAGLQAAFDSSETPPLVERAKAAKQKAPKMKVRLLTSEKDYFLAPMKKLSTELGTAGVEHQLDVVRGDHSYEFNRGPGVYEMLVFHGRALRGETFVP